MVPVEAHQKLVHSCRQFALICFLLADPSFANDWSQEVRGHFNEPHTPANIHALAKKEGKPAMIILMTTWCGACAGLRTSVNSGSKVRPLLDKFVVAYAEDDDQKHEWTEWGQDYVPQTYFFSPGGKQLPVHASTMKYKYFFADENTLEDAMKRALDLSAKGDAVSSNSTSFDPVHAFDPSIADHFADNLKQKEVFDKAAAANKPFMVLLSQPWCDACQILVKSINEGKETRDLLGAFIITVAHGENGQLEWQERDQNYVPQAYFFDVDGTKLEVDGPHKDRGYNHFFASDHELASAMAMALDQSKAVGEL